MNRMNVIDDYSSFPLVACVLYSLLYMSDIAAILQQQEV